jgi:dipeptidase E
MTGQIITLGGGGFSMEPDNLALDRYILSSWHGSNREPRVCFIPTATGDSTDYINRFYLAFEKLPCRPTHLSLVDPPTPGGVAACPPQPLGRQGFAHNSLGDSGSSRSVVGEAVSGNDIFYVGGGNTREMLAVWRQCRLDQALTEAWQAGKILCGISAGAICWFEQAISDSVVEGELHPLKCLGLLPGTACPHYNEPGRRETFHRCLASGEVSPGYGIDNCAAVHFEGIKLANVVVSRPDALAYHVTLANGQVTETVVRTERTE